MYAGVARLGVYRSQVLVRVSRRVYRDLLPHFYTSLWHTAHVNALDSLRLKPRALVASIGPVAGLGHSPVGGRVGPWL